MASNTNDEAVTIITITKKNIKLPIENYMGSVHYAKHIIPLLGINIIKNRIDYHIENFDTHTLNDVPYVTIKPTIPTTGYLYLLKIWLKSAMDAVDKRYLEDLYMVIRDKYTLDVFEYYKFEIKYLPKDEEMVPMDKSKILENTSKLFSQINCLQEQTKLKSDDISLFMQLVCNKRTPGNYVALHFEYGPGYDFDENPNKYVGGVDTQYHKIDILCNNNLHEQFSCTSNYKKLKRDEDYEELEVDTVENCNKRRKLNEEDSLTELEVTTEYTNSNSTLENDIDCMCRIKYNFKDVSLIQCIDCGKQSHVPCLGFKSVYKMPQPFTCFNCCQIDIRKYVDTHFHACETEGRYSIYNQARLFLYYVIDCEHAADDILNKIPGRFLLFFLRTMEKVKLLKWQSNKYIPNMPFIKTKANILLFHET